MIGMIKNMLLLFNVCFKDKRLISYNGKNPFFATLVIDLLL